MLSHQPPCSVSRPRVCLSRWEKDARWAPDNNPETGVCFLKGEAHLKEPEMRTLQRKTSNGWERHFLQKCDLWKTLEELSLRLHPNFCILALKSVVLLRLRPASTLICSLKPENETSGNAADLISVWKLGGLFWSLDGQKRWMQTPTFTFWLGL